MEVNLMQNLLFRHGGRKVLGIAILCKKFYGKEYYEPAINKKLRNMSFASDFRQMGVSAKVTPALPVWI